MTDLANVPAGRELDVLVAKAMGVELGVCCDGERGTLPDEDGWFCKECGARGYWDEPEGYSFHKRIAKRYSSDWGAAGEALEWLHKRKWSPRLVGGTLRWYVETIDPDSLRDGPYCSAPTPQLAIARAVAMIGEERRGRE